MKALHRSGQQGAIGAYDVNGFAEFRSATGAAFTVHRTEIIEEGASYAQERAARRLWSSWPAGTIRIAIERSPTGAASFVVHRLDTAREVQS